MRVAITGAAGLFGYGLVQVFRGKHEVFALTHDDVDITAGENVRRVFTKLRPELIIHPAGIPDIDLCEAEPARAFQVNFHGARHVAEAAREVNASLVHISTDAVFDGKKQTPYTERDGTIPPTVYGRTKLRAEQSASAVPNHYIFRVSALFGPGKINFVERVISKIRNGERIEVASDQLGSATSTLDAAQKIMEVVEARRPGLYHLSNQGACTRLELAQRAAELAGLDACQVIGKPSSEMARRAVRLKYAVMEMGALQSAGFALPRPWQAALTDYIRTLQL